MESSKPSSEEDNHFLDASEDFPFYDCLSACENSDLSSWSPPDIPSSAANLRRWRLVSGRKLKYADSDSDSDPGPSSSCIELDSGGKSSSVEKSHDLYGDRGTIETDIDVSESAKDTVDTFGAEGKDCDVIDSCRDRFEWFDANGKDLDVTDSGGDRVDRFQGGNGMSQGNAVESTVTTVSDGRVDDSVESVPEPRETISTDWSLLIVFAGLVIKAIGLQLNLIIGLITFPPWLLYSCCVFVLDPFGTMRRSKRYLTSRVASICNMVLKKVSPITSGWLNDHKPMLKVALRFGWGLFWAIYVAVVLFALLVSALVLSGFTISYFVEEPLVVKESLNFDYTKNSPEAYVPIISCAGVGSDGSCKKNVEMEMIMGSRSIPMNHKSQVTVLLTLPESEYNRNLGMFQVRVDFLSADGQNLASSRHPCMLRFRSEPIRLVHTLLKIAPLLTGYASEIQTLNLKFKGFVEKDIPTACLKVMIEQRAEFRPGAGVPELYDASLVLESELPFFKRIIWSWRKTLFVWISMSLFTMELLFSLVCCRPLIMPRTRHRDRTRSSSNTYNPDGRERRG